MRRLVAVVVALVLGATLAPSTVAAAPPPPAAGVECAPTLPGPRAVVQLAFVVLLRRCPDPAGAAAWEASLRDGLSPETFARRIAATPEARGVVVGDAYEMVLGRRAAAGEKAFWAGWLKPYPGRSRRHDQLLAELAASDELYAVAGRRDVRFVELVYERILGRPASTSDRDYWVRRLASSPGGRRALARTLLRLPEPLGATVTAAWREVLGADPDANQRAWHVALLRGDGDRLALSARLVGSAAFDDRAQARAIVVPGRYVALGDSYVVGEGNPPLRGGQDDGCSWSPAGYPEVARTSSEQVPSDLDMVACSGSYLQSLYGFELPDGERYPGQLDALAEGESPTLVTLTVGGNDIGFVPILTTCLQVLVGSSQLNPAYDDADCDEWLDETAPAAIEELRTGQDAGDACAGHVCSLEAAVADVVAAAPDARVVVVGYPPLMPSRPGGCAGPVRWADGTTFQGARWLFDRDAVPRGRAVIAGLNGVLRDAAEAAGATYADPTAIFAGHSVCDADPWIHGLILHPGGSPDTASFHPNRRGGVALARALIDSFPA